MAEASTSTSFNRVVQGSETFKITGYSLKREIGIGQSLISDAFNIGGHTWAIEFYPYGADEVNGGLYVSVYIVLASEATDVRGVFDISLLDRNGNQRHVYRDKNPGPYTLKCKGSKWGSYRYYRRRTLNRSEYLIDDTLSIHFSVGVVKSHTEGPMTYVVELPPSDLGKCLGSLLKTGHLSDCIFEVGVEQSLETFNAHKAVLAARSPYFRKLFRNMLNDGPVKVLDIKACVFQAMLHFIYTDSLPGEITCNSEEVLPIFLDLLVAADKYCLDRLKEVCEAYASNLEL